MAAPSLPPLLSTANRNTRAHLLAALSSKTDECVPWGGTIKNDGYGVYKTRYGQYRANRAVCELAHGRPPSEGWFAMHECNNPTCVNPRHLSWGSPQDNSSHMKESGRSMYGTKAGHAVLTEQVVLLIRRTDPRITNEDLSRALGISKITISKARAGRSWRHLDDAAMPAKGHTRRRRNQKNGVQIPLLI